MDKKLTDSEIVSTLQKNLRDSKRINSSYALLNLNLLKETIDLINRLQTENEEQERAILNTLNRIKEVRRTAKAEAYKECVDKIKALFPSDDEPYQYWEIHEGADNLLKELVGDSNG